MIDCPRCGKSNQEHYKFCLGCGAELPRDSDRPKSFRAPTPAGGLPIAEEESGGASGAAPAGDLTCPQCSSTVPTSFRFCGSCGYDMQLGQPSIAPPADSIPPPESFAVRSDAVGHLVLIQPDGNEGESVGLPEAPTMVGRATGSVFEHDAYLSPQHAESRFEGGQLVVRDLDSLNGIYIRVGSEIPIELVDGSVFRVGQQIIRYEAPRIPDAMQDGTQMLGSPHAGSWGRLCLMVGKDAYGNCFPIPPNGLHIGRERGDAIVPEDGYVSGLHCRVYAEAGHVFLLDVGSSNGTFVRVIGESAVPPGSLLLIGQQLFRADYA